MESVNVLDIKMDVQLSLNIQASTRNTKYTLIFSDYEIINKDSLNEMKQIVIPNLKN